MVQMIVISFLALIAIPGLITLFFFVRYLRVIGRQRRFRTARFEDD